MDNPNETQVQKDRIRVFKSTNKKTENHPDYWGRFNIGEQEFDVALWNSTSKSGTSYLSGEVQPSRESEAGESEAQSEMF
tara:strand:+ start:209 stop:448 length:240 start_codon:yes stop_codon:yes gene_type:complete